MKQQIFRTAILVVEDNPGDARLLKEYLADTTSNSYELQFAETIGETFDLLRQNAVDLVLSDLNLPDCNGLETLAQLKQATAAPVVVLTGINDEALALDAVQQGAQDYLTKGQFDARLLRRTIRYALERHRLLQRLEKQSLQDEMTGLFNRRGFLTLAESQMKIADRSNRQLCLVYVDLDGLKRINDSLGHKAGDQAIVALAQALRATFREQDIIARLGGDEFAILAIDAGADTGPLVQKRFLALLNLRNTTGDLPFALQASMGSVLYDPKRHASLDSLLAEADDLMYAQKESHRNQNRHEQKQS